MTISDKKYHFITGLPRSGSTLLSSILKQNPKFHASITDPLATLVKGALDTMQEGPGMRHEVPADRRETTLKHMVEGFYSGIDKSVIFNTNRAWTLLTPLMAKMYPTSRMIVCVRDIKWILDSFELAHRRHPLDKNSVFGGNNGTVYSRMDSLMTDDGIVGFPYLGVKQAITSAEKKNLMLVEYDQLCKNPEGMLKAIYNFIGEEYFAHDFNNVEASWDEYDSEIGIPLHTVKKKVEYKQRETIIPPDIIEKYSRMEVWK